MNDTKTSLFLCNQNPTDENILNTFISEDQKNLKPNIIKYLQNNRYPNICKYLQNRYSYFTSYTEVIYCIFNNYNDIGKNCSICGKPLQFVKFSFGYAKYCCNECSKIGRSKKFSENWHNKYNTPEKIKNRIDKIKQTKLKIYNDENYNNTKKCKETWIKNYGVDNPQKSKIIKNKTKQTCLERYGVENVYQAKWCKEKIQKTNLEKYGYITPVVNPEIKNYHIHQTLCRKNMKQKRKTIHLIHLK